MGSLIERLRKEGPQPPITEDELRNLMQRDTPWLELQKTLATFQNIRQFRSRIVRHGKIQYTFYSALVYTPSTVVAIEKRFKEVTRTDVRIQNCIIKSTGWYNKH